MLLAAAQFLVYIFAFALPSCAALLTSEWHPRSYAAPRALTPIKIDGDIYKKAWDDIPWSHDFLEIRGDDSPAEDRPQAATRTRVKMQWDDEFLYIAAEMTANDWPIEAHFVKRNEPIFQKDSDIEVFLDTDESNHNYKELEVNAKNTVWNLMLNKPYSAGGEEHSGREQKEGEPKYWDVKGQTTASKMYGSLGKENPDGKWVSEIKLSHTDSLFSTSGSKPTKGKYWRINFSRVEKQGKVNWVWSPQKIWKPTEGKYLGQVNMHAPDAWGYVVFEEAGGRAGPMEDWTAPNAQLKAAAHQLFYAEKYATDPAGGGKLLSVEQLKKKQWVNTTLFQDLVAEVEQASDSWTARAKDSSGCIAEVRADNLFSYKCGQLIFGMVLTPLRTTIFVLLGVMIAATTVFVVRAKTVSKPSGTDD
jgi:hypothetical protein